MWNTPLLGISPPVNEPFQGAQDEVVSDGTLVIPQPIVRLNVLAAIPLLKKLFAKDQTQAEAQGKAEPLTPSAVANIANNPTRFTLYLEVRLKKPNGQEEIISSNGFNTTENWRNFTQTIEIAKDKLADCEEGELILKWYSNVQPITPKVWIDELKVERSSLEVMTWADYYPYGLVMREGTCSSYRYQYQGETAEKDKETGWNHRAAFRFELREYDPVTGRWLSTDPYGEFWSSYVGMGNDPVNNIDPDGGETNDNKPTWFGRLWRNIFYGSSVTCPTGKTPKKDRFSFDYKQKERDTAVKPDMDDPWRTPSTPEFPTEYEVNSIPSIGLRIPPPEIRQPIIKPIVPNRPNIRLSFQISFIGNQPFFSDPVAANNNLSSAARTFSTTPNATRIFITVRTERFAGEPVSGTPGLNFATLLQQRGSNVRNILIRNGIPRTAFGANWLIRQYGQISNRTTIRIR